MFSRRILFIVFVLVTVVVVSASAVFAFEIQFIDNAAGFQTVDQELCSSDMNYHNVNEVECDGFAAWYFLCLPPLLVLAAAWLLFSFRPREKVEARP